MYLTTRLRILDHLRKHQTASVRELGRALGMTGANIRHHLAVLESNDLIEFINQRREGRGRPVNVYGLSRHVLGDGLGELVEALLSVWLKGTAYEVQETSLRSVAQQLVGENVIASNVPILRRLTLAVERLNELHYQAHWEAGGTGPRILLGHCPYAGIIDRHPEVCRIDAHILELLLTLPACQSSKLEQGAAGLPQCVFVMG